MPVSWKMFTHAGITRKIIILLFTSSILPLMILAGIFYGFYVTGQKQGIGEVQQEIGNRIATNITAYIERTSAQVKLFAGTVDMSPDGKQALQSLSEGLLDRVIEFDNITIMDLQGQEISKVSRYYTFRPFELTNRADKPSFQAALQGKNHIGSVEISTLSKFPRIQISVPILNDRDRITGVLAVDVSVSKMWAYISKYSIGENRYAYIVDSNGRLIAYQDLSSVLEKRDLGAVPGVTHLLNGRTGVFEYTGLKGRAVIGANTTVPLTGWGIVVETPSADAYRSLHELTIVFAIVFSLTLLLALGLGLRFSFRGIVYPIRRLQEEANRIAQGEFGDAIQVTRTDELGQLARSFNTMTQNLNKTTVSRDLLMQEIAEREKTEAALKKSEATLKSIFRVSPIGIGLVHERTFRWTNDRLNEMLGVGERELVEKSARMVYPHDDEFQRVGRELYDQIRRHGTGTVETRWRRADGRTIEVLLNAAPLDASDLSAGMTFTALDITERKQAEEALRASAEIVRFIPSGLFVYQYEPPDRLVLLDGNPAAEYLTRIDIDACRGKNFHDIWPAARGAGILQSFLRVMETGRIYESDDLVYRDGRLDAVFRIRAFPMPAKRLGVAFEDITAQRKNEQERRQLEEQLRQSHKMEAVGTMAGGIAHEFNNILGIILGNTELALEDATEMNSVQYSLEEVRKASLRGREVVRQILSFARKTPATRKPVMIRTVIQESLKLIRAMIPTSIKIRQNIQCDEEMVLGNPTEINQILINLCSNSSHAIDQETGILEIGLEQVTLGADAVQLYEDIPEGAYVKLSVKDTGTGIKPEIMNRIFDPYFTTKDVDKGLGMGLAVVYGLVKKHEGAIRFLSEVGKGTVAEVLLPVTTDPVPAREEKTDELPAGTERILLVDDEASLAAMIQSMLERQGYEVIAKTSSREALETFLEDADSFDLVITDMAMPEIPGDRLAQKMIRIRSDIPIILCTGFSERMDESKSKFLGIRAFAVKPLQKTDLLQTVRTVLDQASGAALPES